MLDSQGGEEHELHTKTDRSSEGASQEVRSSVSEITVIRPLCVCSADSSEFVVYTCPRCLKVALRAMEALL